MRLDRDSLVQCYAALIVHSRGLLRDILKHAGKQVSEESSLSAEEVLRDFKRTASVKRRLSVRRKTLFSFVLFLMCFCSFVNLEYCYGYDGYKLVIGTEAILEENPYLSVSEASRIALCLLQASWDRRFLLAGIPEDEAFFLLLSIANVESHFRQSAVSKKQAVGIMQVHWPSWKDTFTADCLRTACCNIMAGKEILIKYLLEEGDLVKALYRYVGKPWKQYALKVLSLAVHRYKKYRQEIDGLHGFQQRR